MHASSILQDAKSTLSNHTRYELLVPMPLMRVSSVLTLLCQWHLYHKDYRQELKERRAKLLATGASHRSHSKDKKKKKKKVFSGST